MNDIQSLQKELQAAQANVAKIQKDLETAATAKFTGLPAQVGLKTVDALIKALIPFASGVTKGKLKAAFAGGVPAAKPAEKAPPKSKRKPRARLDDAAKAKIVAALKSGDKTAAAIATDFDVSMGTVNGLKAEAGLTKKRK